MKPFLFLVLFTISAHAHAHEAGETTAQIGEGKAVEAVDEHKGLKLGEKAKKTLNVKTQQVGALTKLPDSSILNITDKRAIYVLRDGWFSLIYLDRKPESRAFPPGLKPTDEIVVSGGALIRVAHINVSESGDEEHEGHTENESHEENEKDENHEHREGEKLE